MILSFFESKKTSRASACAIVLGKPSNKNPAESEFLSTSFCNIFIVTSSGTKSPLSINVLASFPKSVSFFMLNLKISPVER